MSFPYYEITVWNEGPGSVFKISLQSLQYGSSRRETPAGLREWSQTRRHAPPPKPRRRKWRGHRDEAAAGLERPGPAERGAARGGDSGRSLRSGAGSGERSSAVLAGGRLELWCGSCASCGGSGGLSWGGPESLARIWPRAGPEEGRGCGTGGESSARPGLRLEGFEGGGSEPGSRPDSSLSPRVTLDKSYPPRASATTTTKWVRWELVHIERFGKETPAFSLLSSPGHC